MLNKNEMKIITNTLSSLYSWPSDNLQKDFVNFIQSECVNISKEKLVNIFNKYELVPPLERESAYFDVELFISKHLSQ